MKNVPLQSTHTHSGDAPGLGRPGASYRVVREYTGLKPNRRMARDLSLSDALERCTRPEASGWDWFDRIEKETE